jgi:hypothetical protein
VLEVNCVSDRARRASQWQTDSWLELYRPRQLACPGTFRAYRRWKHLYDPWGLYPYVLDGPQISSDRYSLASLRYDLSKLRAKELRIRAVSRPLLPRPFKLFRMAYPYFDGHSQISDRFSRSVGRGS